MSDDESGDEGSASFPRAAESGRIFFGSLELQSTQQLQRPLASGAARDNDEAMLSSDDEDSEPALERHQLSSESLEAKRRAEELLRQIEDAKKSKAILLPADDSSVRRLLRKWNEPITLFGELPPERRERLRRILFRLQEQGVNVHEAAEQSMQTQQETQTEIFYTEGTAELKQARLWIASYSLPRAAQRVARERVQVHNQYAAIKAASDEPVAPVSSLPMLSPLSGFDMRDSSHPSDLKSFISGLHNSASQVGDERPLSCCVFSPDSSHLLTASQGGSLRLWSIPDANSEESKFHFNPSHERVTGVAFHPQSFAVTHSASVCNFASCGMDPNVQLWSLDRDTPLHTLSGHTNRLCKVAFHPSGRYLGSTSYDHTWRLWDVETAQSLLTQEGHSSAVYGINFQCDGSLVATTDVGGIVRVWDLRSGRSVLALEGHVKDVLCVDFSPNGFLLATGSDDNTVRIWDLRKKQCAYTIPAHRNMITSVKFEPVLGRYLATSSFDKTCKIWSAQDYTLQKTLAGHESKVMAMDISQNGQYLASSSYDRTWKLWSYDSFMSL